MSLRFARVYCIALLGLSSLAAAGYAHAADYVSVAEGSAVLYDAPSLKAKKVFVVSRYLPLEQVVSLEDRKSVV